MALIMSIKFDRSGGASCGCGPAADRHPCRPRLDSGAAAVGGVMSLRATVRTMAVAGLTSGAFRDLRRSAFAARRKLSGKQPTVHYFHQADDPYSHLAAQLLHPLLQRYYILIEPWLVPPPDDSAAPDRHRLLAIVLPDATRLARRYQMCTPPGTEP